MVNSPHPTVHEAILAVMEQVGSLEKSGYNEHQRFNFRSVDAVVAALQPLFIANGLTVVPKVINGTSSDREGQDGRLLRFATVIVEFTITGPGGDFVVASMVGEAFDASDKAMNKAISAATKYFLFYTFWPPVSVEDADSSHYEARGQRTTTSRPAAQVVPPARTSVREVVGQRAQEVREAAPLLSEGQGRNLYRLWHHVLGWSNRRYAEEIQLVTGQPIVDDRQLTSQQASALISALKQHAGEEESPRRDGDPGPQEPPHEYAPGEEEF